MATTVTYKYSDGKQSDLTTVNYHSETTSSLSEYFQQRIPRYATITNATVVARVKTSLSSKADIKYFFADGDSNDHRTTVYEKPQAVGNSYTEISGEMKNFWNSATQYAGKCSSQYSRLYVYMNATIPRRFTIDWITYNLTYECPKLTFNVSTSDDRMGTVSGGGTFDVKKGAQTKLLQATPNPGYRFVKWQGYQSSTLPSMAVTFSDSDIAGTNVTWYFTAVFVPINYTISFDGNGSTDGSMPDISTEFGQDVTINNAFSKRHSIQFDACGGSSCNPIIHEDAFLGFSDANSIKYNGTTYAGSDFDAPYYSNTYPDLFAAFGYNKYSLIQHYVNNGIGEGRSATGSERGTYPDGAVVTSLTTAFMAKLKLYAQWDLTPVKLPNTARAGYIFEGWYEDSAYTKSAGDAGADYYPGDATVLYAKWKKKYQPPIISVSVNPNPANAGQGYIIAVGFREA